MAAIRADQQTIDKIKRFTATLNLIYEQDLLDLGRKPLTMREGLRIAIDSWSRNLGFFQEPPYYESHVLRAADEYLGITASKGGIK